MITRIGLSGQAAAEAMERNVLDASRSPRMPRPSDFAFMRCLPLTGRNTFVAAGAAIISLQ
jgi:hypothetical protein